MPLFNWFKGPVPRIRAGQLRFSPQGRFITFWIIIAFFLIIFWWTRSILSPFLWAMVTAYLFYPVINFLEEKTKLHRVAWIFLLYVMLAGVAYWAVLAWLPHLQAELADLMAPPSGGSSTFVGKILDLPVLNLFGVEINFREHILALQEFLRNELPRKLFPLVANVLERGLHVMVYFVATFYLLRDSDRYLRRAIKLVPQQYRREVVSLGSAITETLGSYLRGMFVLVIIMSVLTFIALSILRVKYAFVLSIVTGVLEVIPLVGPITATTLACLVALQQPHVAYGLSHVTLTLLVAGAYLVLRQTEDYVVIPSVVGKFVHVHPLVVIFALLAGAHFGGTLGLLLALPIAAVLKVIFSYFYGKLVEEEAT